MKSFGSMRRNFNIPSPKSQSPKKEPVPKTRRPMLNSGASPHANRLARPPRFPEIFEEDEAGSDALEDDRAQSPSPVTRCKKPRSTSSPHMLARPSSPTPPVLPVPIIATIQVDIGESFPKQSEKRISRRQSGLITVANSVGSGNSSSGSSSSRGRAASPLREHLAPRSARRCGAMPGLQRKKKSMRPSMDTDQLKPTRRSHSSVHQVEGRRSVHWRRRKPKKRQQKVVGNAGSVVFAKISRYCSRRATAGRHERIWDSPVSSSSRQVFISLATSVEN